MIIRVLYPLSKYINRITFIQGQRAGGDRGGFPEYILIASTNIGQTILCSGWVITYSEAWGGGRLAASFKELDFTDCYEQQRVT